MRSNDILSAKAAGCPVIGVRYGYGDMDALSDAAETRPDALIDSLPKLYELAPDERGWALGHALSLAVEHGQHL